MNKDKNIEQQYRAAFNGDIQEDNWNVPSSDSWSNISNRIDQKENKKPFWPIFSILFALVSMGMCFSLYSKLSKTKSILNEKLIELESCSRQFSEAQISTSQINNTIENGRETNFKGKSDLVTSVINYRIDSKDNDVSTVKNSSVSTDQINSLNSNYITSESSDEPKKTNLSKSIENLNINVVEKISLAKFLLPVRSIKTPKITTAKLVKHGRTYDYLSFHLEGNGSSIVSNGVHNSALAELLEKEYGELSYGITALYTRQISSIFFISGGISLRQRKFRTNYDITLDYDHNFETHDLNTGSIKFNHSLPTFAGNVDTDLVLSRSLVNNINNDEKVNLDFDTQSSLLEVGTPLSIRYFTSKNMTGFHFGFEVAPYLNIKSNSKVHDVVSHHEIIYSSYSSASKNNENLSLFTISAGFTTGYDISINESTSVGIRGIYSYGLNNLYSSNQYSSSTNTISAGLSLSKRL